MQDFVDMAEAHAWTLQRLREMSGRLTEQAYLRALEAGTQDPEGAQHWMLVFDRMARGLRLTLALEAKLSRERRRDARDVIRDVDDERAEPRSHSPAAASGADPVETECERDCDGFADAAPLPDRIARLKAAIEGAAAEVEQELRPTVRFHFVDGPPTHDPMADVPVARERAEREPPAWRGSG